jgi:predicted Ser/Thr protein kinase
MASAPQTIGRYRVLGELGKGAMGVVYKAQDPTIGRVVALKTMRVDVHGIEAEEMLARFRNEARAAGVLNHPNIVTVFDAGEETGHFYMALECIEGETLQQKIQQRRVLPPEMAVEMARQVCAGLDYAHAHGIIHRDIKPANIMITPDGTAKIMDFGIAKGTGSGITTTGQVMGTPNYMSPEQVKGRPLDGRSDLFSLGVVLYESVTGEKPFGGDNVTTIIYKILHETPAAPRDLDITIHPGLSAIVLKALAKDPMARYQRGAEMARDLLFYRDLGSETPTSGRVAVTSPAPPAAPAPRFEGMDTDAGTPTPPSIKRVPPAAATAPPAVATAPPAAEAAPPKGAPAPPAAATRGNRSLLVAFAVLVSLAVALGAVAAVRYFRAAPPASPPAATEGAPAETPASGSAAPPTTQTTEQPPAAAPTDAPAPAAAKPEAEPAAAAPAKAGSVRLTSTPPGAAVQLDGRSEPAWITPVTIGDLKPGVHTVILSRDGYLPQSHVVRIAAGRKANLALSLGRGGGTLALKSSPPGAKILVDGKDSGKRTPAELRVDPGLHTIALRLDGYKEATTTTKLGAGDTFHFAPELEKAPSAGEVIASPFKRLFGGGIPEGKGQVEVKSKPKGALIFINGKQYDRPTPEKIDLDPGSYTLRVQMDGYQPFETRVQIEKGKSAKVDARLKTAK